MIFTKVKFRFMSDKLHQFVFRIQFVRFKDIMQVFPMFISWLFAQFYKLKHKKIWLICERRNEARENGYWFFKYMCENHPEIESIYAIDEDSTDYGKVKKLGKVVRFGSFKHWLYYWAADKNLSSQKEGKPNAALCYILEVYLGARKNRVYLKHGIIHNYQRWIFKDISKINLMICGAARERDYMNKEFGYSSDELALTGLSRYDNLMAPHVVKRQILIMPTMREWLRAVSSETDIYEQSRDVSQSEYVVTYNKLINNKALFEVLEKNDVELVFYPHNGMQKYFEMFKSDCKKITIADNRHYDVQALLMESAMLVTDYSSIHFDFAYMKKPLVYYQFDFDKYRKGQYQQGYFYYDKDGFGPVVYNEDDLVSEISRMVTNNFIMDESYITKVDGFFAFTDNNNCERIYSAIMNMKQ